MRESLEDFAEKQEEVLQQNDYKDGWEGSTNDELFHYAMLEMCELFDAITFHDRNIIKECCDVANFMMMIADNNK